jgi:hypothetical protein
MVSDDTLRLIALHATRVHSGGWDLDAARTALADLHYANVESLKERYPRQHADMISPLPELGPADAMRLAKHSAVVVIKCVHNYEYQSCEWRLWDPAETERRCAGRKLSEAALANAIRSLPGYDAAPWGL